MNPTLSTELQSLQPTALDAGLIFSGKASGKLIQGYQVVHLDKASNNASGGKFWGGTATPQGPTLNWGQRNTQGQSLRVALEQCANNDPVQELLNRISLWSARKKLTLEDFGNVEFPPEDLATLGSKRIAPPESLRIFGTVKAHSG